MSNETERDFNWALELAVKHMEKTIIFANGIYVRSDTGIDIVDMTRSAAMLREKIKYEPIRKMSKEDRDEIFDFAMKRSDEILKGDKND